MAISATQAKSCFITCKARRKCNIGLSSSQKLLATGLLSDIKKAVKNGPVQFRQKETAAGACAEHTVPAS